MAKKTDFLYGGLFIIGAILTPIILSLLSGGDRSDSRISTAKTQQNLISSQTNSGQSNVSNPVRPLGSEAIRTLLLENYGDTLGKSISNVPATIPSYANQQPGIRPYPNYWANIRIPRFRSQPVKLPDPPTPSPELRTLNLDIPNFETQSPRLRPFQARKTDSGSTNNQFKLQTEQPNRSDVDLSDFVTSAPAREIQLP